MQWFKTLRFRIISICLSLSIFMAFLLSFVVYGNMKDTYIQQDIHYSGLSMKMAMNNIDQYYSQIVNFLLWLSNSREVSRFLTTDQDDITSGAVSVNAFNVVQRQMQSMFLSSPFDKCIISSVEGNYLIVGRNNGDPTDYDIAAQAEMPASSGIAIGEITLNPFRYGSKNIGLMLACGIYKPGSPQKIGTAHLFMSTEVLDEQFNQYLSQGEYDMFFNMDSSFYMIENRKLSSSTVAGLEISNSQVYDAENSIYTADTVYDGVSRQAVIVESPLNRWQLIKLLPEYTLYNTGEDIIAMMLGLGGIVFFGFVLMTVMMTRIINKPVKRICNRVELVATGDFTRDMTIETEDELGYIGKGINSMSANIEKLIATCLEEEQSKKNYEFKVLQTQINPHFLYNTLNSIKWMASIQRAAGITEMTSTLGHMLRLIAQVNTDIISLEKELEFVNDYIVIQSYRYGDTFQIKYDIEDEELLQAKVIKFTIQPLVENAIFHGIEPKNAPGIITIHAFKQDSSLMIDVEDDGAGISPERLEKLNRFPKETVKEKNNIGLYNIHHRIQLEYGEEYGLQIESTLGKGTRIRVHIPYRKEESYV